jgi:hypothetical protein
MKSRSQTVVSFGQKKNKKIMFTDCRAEDEGKYLIQGSVLSACRQKMESTIRYTVHVSSTKIESSISKENCAPYSENGRRFR